MKSSFSLSILPAKVFSSFYFFVCGNFHFCNRQLKFANILMTIVIWIQSSGMKTNKGFNVRIKINSSALDGILLFFVCLLVSFSNELSFCRHFSLLHIELSGLDWIVALTIVATFLMWEIYLSVRYIFRCLPI